jgi:hypothetical protein
MFLFKSIILVPYYAAMLNSHGAARQLTRRCSSARWYLGLIVMQKDNHIIIDDEFEAEDHQPRDVEQRKDRLRAGSDRLELWAVQDHQAAIQRVQEHSLGSVKTSQQTQASYHPPRIPQQEDVWFHQ